MEKIYEKIKDLTLKRVIYNAVNGVKNKVEVKFLEMVKSMKKQGRESKTETLVDERRRLIISDGKPTGTHFIRKLIFPGERESRVISIAVLHFCIAVLHYRYRDRFSGVLQ